MIFQCNVKYCLGPCEPVIDSILVIIIVNSVIIIISNCPTNFDTTGSSNEYLLILAEVHVHFTERRFVLQHSLSYAPTNFHFYTPDFNFYRHTFTFSLLLYFYFQTCHLLLVQSAGKISVSLSHTSKIFVSFLVTYLQYIFTYFPPILMYFQHNFYSQGKYHSQ